MFCLRLLLIVLVTCHTAAMGQGEREFSWRQDISQLNDSTQESLNHLEQKMRAMEKILLKIDKRVNIISKQNNSTQECLQLLEEKAEQIKRKIAIMKEEVISEVSSDVSQLNVSIRHLQYTLFIIDEKVHADKDICIKLNDSVYEWLQLLEKKIEDAERKMLSRLAEMKEEIKIEFITQKEILSPTLQHFSVNSIGSFQCNPARSCKDIKNHNPNSTSGYYYIKLDHGPIIRVYCKMTSCKGVGGPWMRVVDFNADNTSHSCPSGLWPFTNIRRRCGMPSNGPGCASTMFDIHGIPYQKVCGKVAGYQESTPDALGNFHGYYNIDGAYVDGVSLTYGNHPRKHIWTFTAAVDETDTHGGTQSICHCTNRRGSSAQVPSFIGRDYFCDTGSRSIRQYGRLYGDDPLWDGAGCGGSSTCCSFNSPPWFMKQLSSSTSDDLELRVCRDEPRSNEDVTLKSAELYVQ